MELQGVFGEVRRDLKIFIKRIYGFLTSHIEWVIYVLLYLALCAWNYRDSPFPEFKRIVFFFPNLTAILYAGACYFVPVANYTVRKVRGFGSERLPMAMKLEFLKNHPHTMSNQKQMPTRWEYYKGFSKKELVINTISLTVIIICDIIFLNPRDFRLIVITSWWYLVQALLTVIFAK